ncbi:hypothetical protein [Streptomyces sp. NPDC001978]|uniref:hypothetical protein n=1 Tax=Streptomyces sp. NPDC001978 TaxID=3364627 RepID=UPI0036BBDEC4
MVIATIAKQGQSERICRCLGCFCHGLRTDDGNSDASLVQLTPQRHVNGPFGHVVEQILNSMADVKEVLVGPLPWHTSFRQGFEAALAGGLFLLRKVL